MVVIENGNNNNGNKMKEDNKKNDDEEPILKFKVINDGNKCPFGNKLIEFNLYSNYCLWLDGNSGLGKTTLTSYISGLGSSEQHLQSKLNIKPLLCEWNKSIPDGERCGMLFQQTTLIDSLSVNGNVALALNNCSSKKKKQQATSKSNNHEQEKEIKRLLENVGLNYVRDGNKRVTELSGGMARRASLALQLAQHKRIIILDEPFTGLDRNAAISIAKELYHLRTQKDGPALILITHEPDLAKIVMGTDNNNNDNDGSSSNNNSMRITLTPPIKDTSSTFSSSKASNNNKLNLFGITFYNRFIERLIDYICWSMPLIVLTFVACGLAIAMLSCDILQRVDVTNPVLQIVEKEIKPLLKLVTGEDEANPMTLMMIKIKIRSMLNTVIPDAKATLYAIGMAKLFVLEIGPLLTSLLLCGRIGGTYAGMVATMRATSQIKLLQTLGIKQKMWTLYPSLIACLIASPLLTSIGTIIALYLGGIIAPTYNIGTYTSYMNQLRTSIFPTLRLNSLIQWENEQITLIQALTSHIDLRSATTTNGNSTTVLFDTFIEIITYPPIFLLVKSITFICITLFVAEICSSTNIIIGFRGGIFTNRMVVSSSSSSSSSSSGELTPRNVPSVITSSVVISSLLVIIMDWGFSQLLLKRK